MLTGIDHVILAVRDPDGAAQALEDELGLRSGPGGRHAAHGTHNRLCWLGDSYLELMGVFDAAIASASWWGAYVSRLLDERGEGYAGVVLASDDLAADASRLAGAGSALGEPQPGERARPDGDVVRWRAALPARPDPDLGLAFLIEHEQTAAEWRPADRLARATQLHPLGTTVALRRLELPVADVRSATMRIHRDLGVAFRPSLGGGGARDGAVGRQTLRLLRATEERPLVVLEGGSRPVEARLLGCAWQLVPRTA